MRDVARSAPGGQPGGRWPRRRPGQLIAAGALLGVWLAFLAWMAWTA